MCDPRSYPSSTSLQLVIWIPLSSSFSPPPYRLITPQSAHPPIKLTSHSHKANLPKLYYQNRPVIWELFVFFNSRYSSRCAEPKPTGPLKAKVLFSIPVIPFQYFPPLLKEIALFYAQEHYLKKYGQKNDF